MFAKRNRLAKDRDVQMVYKRGRSIFTPFFTIKLLPSARSEVPARFTVVVSTKVAKHAVRRNRIKRVIREVIRRNLSLIRPGDYMIVVKPAIVQFTHAELSDTIQKAFQKNKLLT
jgi:ribonuclease P protein component